MNYLISAVDKRGIDELPDIRGKYGALMNYLLPATVH